MSKIRVLSDHLANQIAAGEVVERPASVAKELVENAVDAGARRIVLDVEAGGRRLLRVAGGRSRATRVLIEGGRMRDVKDAAHPRGTTITVRDLFFNVPARRKFLRSEATESFHLTNLVTHYALAHPEISFALTSNGREVLRASAAENLRERAYQIFGAEFLENLLEVEGVRGDAAARV